MHCNFKIRSKSVSISMNNYGAMILAESSETQLLAQKIFTSPFTNLLFEIGRRDSKIQEMVSESMSESLQGKIDLKGLVLRTLLVCPRGALGIRGI